MWDLALPRRGFSLSATASIRTTGIPVAVAALPSSSQSLSVLCLKSSCGRRLSRLSFLCFKLMYKIPSITPAFLLGDSLELTPLVIVCSQSVPSPPNPPPSPPPFSLFFSFLLFVFIFFFLFFLFLFLALTLILVFTSLSSLNDCRRTAGFGTFPRTREGISFFPMKVRGSTRRGNIGSFNTCPICALLYANACSRVTPGMVRMKERIFSMLRAWTCFVSTQRK
mmetsp:Transcript_10842/g.15011  ORF Transcript_10842/g.15011 Transcript_10842/m.15011 type:complete len:224 (-) Transcript_10842:27-698(-)